MTDQPKALSHIRVLDLTRARAGPTCFRFDGDDRPYSRLLLPMWGDGRASMILGAVEVG